jgi:molybdenum cofactor cytidylyltransferase
MICAVVLAAGRSARMGAQKLLLPLAGRPMIAGIVDEVLAGALNKVFVVVGRDAGPVKQALANRPLTFVANPDPDGDMLSSVRCGLRALPADCAAVLVVLGDQPGVTRELIDDLIRRFRETNRGIVVPIHNGKRGHPLLFATRFCEEVMTQHDATGLRGLLQSHPDEVFEMPVAKADILEDIDTPEDYERKR